MIRFYLCGWIPILTEKIVCIKHNCYTGWFFALPVDYGACQYIAYKFEFDKNTGLINKLYIHSNEINKNSKFHSEYNERKTNDIRNGEQLYKTYCDNPLSIICKISCDIKMNPDRAHVISNCQCEVHNTEQFEIINWGEFIFRTLRDFYHVHTHHAENADSCLKPYKFDHDFQQEDFFNCIWKQYQEKIVEFQQDIAKRANRVILLDLQKNKQKNKHKKILKFYETSLNTIQDYRGELVYAKSFCRRFALEKDYKIISNSLDDISKSFEIKFDYFAVKYEHISTTDSLKFAKAAIFIAIAIGAFQLIVGIMSYFK